MFRSAVVILLLTSAALAQDKVLLSRKAKVGDVTRTSMDVAMTADIGGRQVSLGLKGIEAATVSAVGADGQLTVRARAESMSVTLDGNPMPLPPESPSSTVVMTRLRSLISYTPGDSTQDAAFEARMFNATTIVFADKPVGVGDTWTREVKADAALGTVAAIAQFKITAFEKVESASTAKVEMTYREAAPGGIQSSGSFWIDVATGEDVKTEFEFRNVPFPQIGLVNGSMRQNRLTGRAAVAAARQLR